MPRPGKRVIRLECQILRFIFWRQGWHLRRTPILENIFHRWRLIPLALDCVRVLP